MISVIIPTLNEAFHLPILLQELRGKSREQIEIIVVDGGSKDDTHEVARKEGVKVVTSPKRGRNHQMNHGAALAKGKVLYFLHADTLPPPSFVEDINAALAEGYKVGCYRFKFNSPKLLLKINSFFTRFDKMWCRGGDQSLFVEKRLFDTLGGFDPQHCIMEEYDFIRRARKHTPFKIMKKNIIVSARKYQTNGYFKVQWVNLRAFRMYNKGVALQQIKEFYTKRLS